MNLKMWRIEIIILRLHKYVIYEKQKYIHDIIIREMVTFLVNYKTLFFILFYN